MPICKIRQAHITLGPSARAASFRVASYSQPAWSRRCFASKYFCFSPPRRSTATMRWDWKCRRLLSGETLGIKKSALLHYLQDQVMDVFGTDPPAPPPPKTTPAPPPAPRQQPAPPAYSSRRENLGPLLSEIVDKSIKDSKAMIDEVSFQIIKKLNYVQTIK
jgi:hypothetical protein